ncbi:unnamed protein product [Strongylus vulgaris]|uniref:Uncharacterized protein n=1 Tax=Strongylus vulgaris TaxID=40348 RepID=A0A3P7KGI9_STRVU|nr:unnamed protein product [Strongylus vulgaris]
MTVRNNYVNHCPNNCNPTFSAEPPAPAPSPTEQISADLQAHEPVAFDLDSSDPINCDPSAFEEATPDEVFVNPLSGAIPEQEVSQHSYSQHSSSQHSSSQHSPSVHSVSISVHTCSEGLEMRAGTSASTPSSQLAYEILPEPTGEEVVVSHIPYRSDSFDSQKSYHFYTQQPSAVIERESTAPCVSPELSQSSGIEEERHYRTALTLPFIDADSVSSLVGNDDLRRLQSVKRLADSPSSYTEVEIVVPEVKLITNIEQSKTPKEDEEKVEIVEPRLHSKQGNHVENNNEQELAQPQQQAPQITSDSESQKQQSQYQQPVRTFMLFLILYKS